ncbi:TPA: hypothetical protein ACQYC6_004089 [Vibrio parahaemolyticus]
MSWLNQLFGKLQEDIKSVNINIHINGDVGDIDAGSGNVNCNGAKSINTGSGNVSQRICV